MSCCGVWGLKPAFIFQIQTPTVVSRKFRGFYELFMSMISLATNGTLPYLTLQFAALTSGNLSKACIESVNSCVTCYNALTKQTPSTYYSRLALQKSINRYNPIRLHKWLIICWDFLWKCGTPAWGWAALLQLFMAFWSSEPPRLSTILLFHGTPIKISHSIYCCLVSYSTLMALQVLSCLSFCGYCVVRSKLLRPFSCKHCKHLLHLHRILHPFSLNVAFIQFDFLLVFNERIYGSNVQAGTSLYKTLVSNFGAQKKITNKLVDGDGLNTKAVCRYYPCAAHVGDSGHGSCILQS